MPLIRVMQVEPSRKSDVLMCRSGLANFRLIPEFGLSFALYYHIR